MPDPYASLAPETELLVSTSQELSLARSMETVQAIVRKVARKLTGADGATFVLRDADQCFYADEDAISPLWKGLRFPMSACISGWAMIHKQPAVIEDIYKDERIPIDAYRPTFVKSLVMVPIRTMEPIGAIGNYWAQRRQPTAREVKLLQALADMTAVAIENVNLYAGLEQRVKERTLQLQIVNRELESFSYSVSHDLRAPLRAIHGYISILAEDHSARFDEEAHRLVGRAMTNVLQMGNLIDSLLAFSRMGRQEISKTLVPMEEMVHGICQELSTRENGRTIKFHFEKIPATAADPSLIHIVWTNLLSNAVKYTRKKEEASIRIGSEQQEDRYIYFVTDNGAGFDMRYYEKLFGVFQRLHSAQEYDGTGIGLATVKRIVEKHGGEVWAKAVPDEGATFYFSLPC